jgi:hypothetical protein
MLSKSIYIISVHQSYMQMNAVLVLLDTHMVKVPLISGEGTSIFHIQLSKPISPVPNTAIII